MYYCIVIIHIAYILRFQLFRYDKDIKKSNIFLLACHHLSLSYVGIHLKTKLLLILDIRLQWSKLIFYTKGVRFDCNHHMSNQRQDTGMVD